jgi:hypothetical protein
MDARCASAALITSTGHIRVWRKRPRDRQFTTKITKKNTKDTKIFVLFVFFFVIFVVNPL